MMPKNVKPKNNLTILKALRNDQLRKEANVLRERMKKESRER